MHVPLSPENREGAVNFLGFAQVRWKTCTQNVAVVGPYTYIAHALFTRYSTLRQTANWGAGGICCSRGFGRAEFWLNTM